MVKAVRFFIGLLLVLSIVALTFGIFLFKDREMLKGRTYKLEQAIYKLAKTVEVDPESEGFVDVPREKLMTYESLEGGEDMDDVLADLVARAQNQRDSLLQTRDKLDRTERKLAETERELAETQRQLAEARQDIANLKETLAQRERTIDEQKDQIAGLEQNKADLEAKVEELNGIVAEKTEKIHDLNNQVAQLERDIVKLLGPDKKLPERIIRDIRQGVKGRVLVVNTEWNFLVIGIAEGQKILPNLELVIQRSEQLVAKVLVTDVKDNRYAVCDILGDYQQLPVQEGDYCVYWPKLIEM